MDKIDLLHNRKKQIVDVSKNIRDEMNELIDKDSFVELSTFSFSKNDFYGEVAEGEGVVTGVATINGYPFSIVAQNANVLSGGISKANCNKIVKCLTQAERTETPVVYLLSSKGVQIGEGVNVLEGLATLLKMASSLKGTVMQYLVINGEVYGQIALLSALCDFTFFVEGKSVLAINSPLVLSAKSGKNIPKEQVGGVKGLNNTNLASFEVKDLGEVKTKILAITELMHNKMVDCDDLNKSFPAFNKACTGSDIVKSFDEKSYLEVGATFSPEVKTGFARIGGIAVATVIFNAENGVELTAQNMKKLNDFAMLANYYELPYVTFVNTLGVRADLETSNSLVLKEIAEYISNLDCMFQAKIAVVYGKAIGLGYTLFTAKSMGYDYTFAFANAKIALFDSVQGAEIEFADEKKIEKSKLAERYADENSDPVHAAKGGYIDNIIEPAFVRQYVISTLQMLQRGGV